MRNYLKKLVGTAGLEPATLAPKISAITYRYFSRNATLGKSAGCDVHTIPAGHPIQAFQEPVGHKSVTNAE